VGGPGFRFGRRDPDSVVVGDQVDFWRVDAVEVGSLLRLKAEMRLPGSTLLEFRLTPIEPAVDGAERSRLTQRVEFHPDGLLGRAYWTSVAPAHPLVFGTLASGIARAAEGHRPACPQAESTNQRPTDALPLGFSACPRRCRNAYSGCRC